MTNVMVPRRKYQVFVSSTFVDLETERQEVSRALLTGHDYIPSGMELFPASSRPSWVVITREMDDSDYVVLILGNRYGSLAPHEQISYTEKEYEHAVAHGIPVLAFLSTDEVPIRRPNQESEDQRQALERFRERVRNDRAVSTWNDGKELAMQVLTALRQEVDLQQRPGWVRGQQATADAPSVAAPGLPSFPSLDELVLVGSPAWREVNPHVEETAADRLARELDEADSADEATFRALQGNDLTAETVGRGAVRAQETGIASRRGLRTALSEDFHLRLPPYLPEWEVELEVTVEDTAGRLLASVEWIDQPAATVLRELYERLGSAGAHPGRRAFHPIEALHAIGDLLLLGLDARRVGMSTLSAGLLQIEPGWIITDRGLVSRERPTFIIETNRFYTGLTGWSMSPPDPGPTPTSSRARLPLRRHSSRDQGRPSPAPPATSSLPSSPSGHERPRDSSTVVLGLLRTGRRPSHPARSLWSAASA